MTLLGVVIIIGVVAGGALLYRTAARLDGEIEAELGEDRDR